MIYYTPAINKDVMNAIREGIMGSFDSPVTGNKRVPGYPWCADNGCFSDNYVGDEKYLAWLEKQEDKHLCAFATAPDVLCDAEETLKRSALMYGPIRDRGFKVALVAQNGLEDLKVPWGDFDVLFIGGDTEWKLGYAAAFLAAQAINRGKTVHMGRVNGIQRLRHAKAIGCVSVDGNHIAYGPTQNMAQMRMWLADINGTGSVCVICGGHFHAVRITQAKTCSAKCRKALEREKGRARREAAIASGAVPPPAPKVVTHERSANGRYLPRSARAEAAHEDHELEPGSPPSH